MQSEVHSVRRAVAWGGALIVALALTGGLAACGGGDKSGRTGSAAKVQPGGTLRIGMVDDPGVDPRDPGYMQEHHWALLNRTLYTFKLTPGETTPVPDLATSPPKVSADGLTYTVHLKPGIHYAPPYASREIVAGDILNSLNDLANPKNATVSASHFIPLEGIDPATGKWTGKNKTITGVTVPDPHTIVFKLTDPKGDFIQRMAWPAMSPTPPGAFTGHEKDYGRYIVASGPYMVDGSQTEDSAHPTPLTGYVPGRSLTLVRNPSWKRSTDDVRGAYPDRIEFSFGDTNKSIAQKVTSGELDLELVTQAPPDVMRQYATNPDLKGRLHINPKVSVRIATLNVAMPPFDDVHVRRAVNFIVNRDDIRRADGGVATSELAYHRFPPNLLDGQLKDYDEYASSSPADALAKAEAEMKQSKYDPGGTGKCTAAVCQNIRTIPADDGTQPDTNIIRQDVAKIGLDLKVEQYSADTAFGKCADPTEKVALCTGLSFGASSTDAGGLAGDLVTASIGPNSCCNVGLIGAGAKQLKGWGYTVGAPLKSFDAEYAKCQAQAGAERTDCFVKMDVEESDLALSLPLLFPNQREIISDRVANYTYDFYGYASLNQIALAQPKS